MRYDVVVIGAGAAGISAARALSSAGKRIVILEARPRIGGRVFSRQVPSLPIPIELGAEFVHGETATTLSIIEAARLTALQLPDTHWWSRGDRWKLVPDFWGKINAVLAKIGDGSADRSFDEFLQRTRGLTAPERELARTFVEGYHAAHAERISARALSAADTEQEPEGEANRQFRLAGPQQAVLDWLAAGVEPDRCSIRTATIVTKIRWSAGSVVVETRSSLTQRVEELRARAALVTVPVGVLKAPDDVEGAISFDPPLPKKKRALARLETGHVVKMALVFSEAFWDAPAFVRERARGANNSRGLPLNFVHSSSRYVPTWWTTAPIRSPILTAWAGAHAADALLAETEETRVERVLDELSAQWRVPRRELDALLTEVHTHDWLHDPFSRGAYSYAGVGGATAHAALAAPVSGTLFFAGEATSGDETGTVAGAIDSGRRAAAEVLRAWFQVSGFRG